MAAIYTKPPGIEDIFPDKINLWNFVLNTAGDTFRLFNYKEIIIPVMEYTDVFSRGIGTETDIVSKEMFTFQDRGERNLTLRPEGTASVVRAYVENGEYNRLAACKLFYRGPMFRAERPQKGRLRQFNQFGAEIFGSSDPYYDYEVMAMMNSITRKLGIGPYILFINSIGCPECRKKYIAELRKYYLDQAGKLCEDCRRRLDKNPLRLLDCKEEKCRVLKNNAPVLTSFICPDCAAHHAMVKEYLNNDGIDYKEDPFLVRGLDYYTRTTFEFTSDDLGGQKAFAAGGRYDNLVETFGGKQTPAVGFAAGIERIILLTGNNKIPQDRLDVFLVHSGGGTKDAAVRIISELRSCGISADVDPESKGFKAQFKKADREKARFAIIIGDNELADKSVTVKNMENGEQQKVTFESVKEHMRTALGL